MRATLAMGAGMLAVMAGGVPVAAGAEASFVHNREAGFVVAYIEYGLSKAAKETGACPNGMTQGSEVLHNMFSGVAGQNQNSAAGSGAAPQRPPATEAEFRQTFQRVMEGPIGQACSNPAAAGPDPNFRTVTGKNVPVEGIDLDGQVSHANGKPAPNTCAHDDFDGFHGEHGIDNQLFRAVGCSNSFQPGASSRGWYVEMLTGAWGILITLKGVDDIRNDPDVEVGFYANADPIQLSPSREPLWNATYAMTQDPRFRAVTHGRIVDGVLTTDPVDLRWWKITNSIWLERPLQDARMRLTLSPEGMLEGNLAGYTPVEALYDFQYGYRSGTDGTGKPAPAMLRSVSAIGAAATLGHTCNGAYHALLAMADGHRDPATGKCTAISTQYIIKAIPAFVVDTATKSSNASLGPPARDQRY